MNVNIIALFIKSIGLYMSASYSFSRIINYSNHKLYKKICIILVILLISLLQCILQFLFPLFYRIVLIYFTFAYLFSKITKTKFAQSLLITLMSFSISYIFSIISFLICNIITMLINSPYIKPSNHYVLILCSILNFIFTYILFKAKKLKHGFSIINNNKNNEFLDIVITLVNMLTIFTYFFIGTIGFIPTQYLVYTFILFSLLTGLIIQKTFTFYHKQKLQTKALKDYEQELAELKSKLQIALSEKEQIIKSNHEFYHRQKALSKKLDILLNSTTSMNTEFGEDLSDIQKRISKLSAEYNAKVSIIPNIEKTNITEIDDMLVYMQSECNTNNIEFNLKINCDMNDILTKFITSSQLETLLGDLIRNSIIAINHSSNNYRSILIVFGIKDGIYEISLWDSGIPFEIDTLVNLGINRASTHLDEGGTGIGFITTFETINSCNASFIINEVTGNNYTKCLSIRFDNKHDYVIISDRIEDIQQYNTINRKIILKKQE